MSKESIYCYYISSDLNFSELLVSITSLKATNPKYRIACMYGDKVSEDSLQILKDLEIILIDGTQFPLNHTIIKEDGTKDEFLCSSKLYLYSHIEYEKIVYLDPDTYILQNLDSAFDYPDGSACKHFMGGWANMNGGLMVIVPNLPRFNEFINQLKVDEQQGFHSYPDDQYYLTVKNHYTERKDLHISYEYNFWPFWINKYKENPVFDEGAVKMWHFMGGCVLTPGGPHYKVFTAPSLKLFGVRAQDYDWNYLEQAKLIITIFKLKYPNVKSLEYPGVYANVK